MKKKINLKDSLSSFPTVGKVNWHILQELFSTRALLLLRSLCFCFIHHTLLFSSVSPSLPPSFQSSPQPTHLHHWLHITFLNLMHVLINQNASYGSLFLTCNVNRMPFVIMQLWKAAFFLSAAGLLKLSYYSVVSMYYIMAFSHADENSVKCFPKVSRVELGILNSL